MPPPLTVLKISKLIENRIDVLGEFSSEEEAQRFVDAAKSEAESDGTINDYDYIIEMPPPKL